MLGGMEVLLGAVVVESVTVGIKVWVAEPFEAVVPVICVELVALAVPAGSV